jgi:hypothetical protein
MRASNQMVIADLRTLQHLSSKCKLSLWGAASATGAPLSSELT